MKSRRFVSPILGTLIIVAGLSVGIMSPAAAATPGPADDVGSVGFDSTLTLDLAANDVGLDDTPVTFAWGDDLPALGDAFIDPEAGILTYSSYITPGEDVLTYQVTDADGETGEATVTITVLPPTQITSDGPLTRIHTDEDLNCAVNHQADTAGEFYGDTACGTFLVVDDTLFSPASIPAGSNAVGTPWTPVEQSPITGTGTATDPFRYSTTVAAGDTGVTVVQTDSYVVGQESFRTSVRVENDGPARDVRLYRAADCYLADSDNGLGSVDAGTGAVACVSPQSNRIEQWLPLSPGSRHYEADFSEVWQKIGDRAQFPNTCRCDEEIDNGAGLSWDISLAADGSATRNSLITFSPVGAVPLTTEKTVDDATVGTGDEVTYTITVNNPGESPASLETISDTLPEGFGYVAGSSSGATTDDPTTEGDTLVWATPTAVPAGGEVTLTFTATVADQPGDYYNNATATATDLFVNPTGETAMVTVEEVTVPEVQPVTNLQAAGAGSGSVVLTWVNPDELDGIVVRWSDQGPPISPTDGNAVPVTGTPETVTIDGLDDGATIYFSVFTTLGGEVSEATSTELSPFSCPDLTPALDGQGGLITGQEWIACSSPNAHEPASTLNTVLSRTGPTQALITSGDREVALPPDDGESEGSDNGTGSRGAYDVSIYRIDLQVPAGSSCLQFDYVFASEEYPEYVGGSFNDGFLAQLDQNDWVVDANSEISATGNFAKMAGGDFISVNSAVFADPSQVSLPDTNGTGYDGMSVALTASTPITAGPHSIYLSIFDAGDAAYDSAAFVDHLRVSDLACQAGSNQPPVAVDDTATTSSGTPVTVAVLANDTDGDGHALTVAEHTDGDHGTVTCTATTCTYAPESGYVGDDAFTYTVDDGHGGTDTATVTVTVTGAPVVAELGISVSRSTVTWPGKVTVNGTASTSTGDPVEGVELELWANTADTTTKVATVTTGADGLVHQMLRPQARTTYVWKSVDPELSSPEQIVKVRPALTMAVSKTALAVRAPLLVQGKSSPSRVGTPVRLQMAKPGKGWKTVKSTTIKQATSTTFPSGRYKFRVTSTASAAMRFRVVIPADAGREAATSAVKKVKFHAAKITAVTRTKHEVVTIKNTGKVPINLQGWKLVNHKGAKLRLAKRIVAPGAKVKISTGKSMFDNLHDKVKLVDTSGFVVQLFRY